MTPFIAQAIAESKLGLALHYPFIYSAVVGLDARRTLEFGAGGSTRVFVDALRVTHGHHDSISTESRELLDAAYACGDRHGAMWRHWQGESDTCRDVVHDIKNVPFDLILHDGSHAADVVSRDIAWAWPRLRPFGLLLVHDTQHSYCGAEVRAGVTTGLLAAHARYSLTTLPYGFGLTIIRKEEPGEGAVSPAPAKATSEHKTALVPFKEQTA